MQLGIQLILPLQIHRTVQQRTGRCYPEPLAQTLMGMAQHLQRLIQVTAPDVAAIDQPQRQNLVGRQTIKNGRILLGRPHQVNMQTVHRQARRQPEAVLQVTEIGRYQLFQRLLLQQVIGPLESALPVLRQIEYQNRFINLHPLHTLCRQPLKDLAVQGQQPLKQLQLVELLALDLAQPQIGQRPDYHGFDPVPQRLGLINLLEQLFPAQGKLLVSGELRHQIVIVGIKPLGHLLGMATTAAAGRTPRHGKQGLQIRPRGTRLAKTLGDNPEHQRVGQNLVIPGKIANRQQLDTGLPLQLPVLSAQPHTCLTQPRLVQIALPERLQRPFQFTVTPDTRKAQIVCQSHRSILPQ